MHISECEKAAQDMECENPKFTIVGPGGEKEAEWLDPLMGIFKFDGAEGFNMSRDLYGLPVTCVNLRCEVPNAS